MKFVKRKPAVFKVVKTEGDTITLKNKEGNTEVYSKEEFKKEFESC